MVKREQLKEHYRFEMDGRKFVYDVNDIRVLEVDDTIWEYYLAAADDGVGSPTEELARRHGPEVAEAVVNDLRQAGLLVAEADAPIPPSPPKREGLHGVTLNVTHGCNLKCTYCFAKQGDYGLGRSLMTEATARKAIDWVAKRSDDEKSARVGFFGGEPMMNMRVIRDTVQYADEQLGAAGKRIRYHITTNGTLLNEQNVEFLADHDNIDVQVSLDGVSEVNDKFRIFANGRGSYSTVVKGIKRLKAATGKLVLRGTILPGAPRLSDSVRHMSEDLGATTVAFEPASGMESHGKTIDSNNMQAIKAEWQKVTEYFSEHIKQGQVKPIGNLLRLLMQIHKRKKTVYGCTAGWANVAVDPSGDIYPCHRFVGESDWKMGNIHSETFDTTIRDQFARNTVDNREPCKSCWVRYTCGGRCAHEAMEATGRISDPDPVRCDLVRHMTELALKTYVRLKPYERQLLEGDAQTG